MRAQVLSRDVVDADMQRSSAIRAAGLLTCVLSCSVTFFAAVTAAGLFGCYGSSCSYELQGYAGSPGSLYAVMGALAVLLAATAVSTGAIAYRGVRVARSWKPVLSACAVVVAGAALFAIGLSVAAV